MAVGEGRRLAYLLRVERKQIERTDPLRCVLETANEPQENSLDENVTCEAMHLADQFKASREVAENRRWGAEEIAARFGVAPHVVKQRLYLGTISLKLLQVYCDGSLTFDQLMAFAITEVHARQEQVYESLSYIREPWIIRRNLTKTHIPSDGSARRPSMTWLPTVAGTSSASLPMQSGR